MVNFPSSLDSLSNPGALTKRNDPGFELHTVISNLNDISEALEAKLGAGSSLPSAGPGRVPVSYVDGTTKWLIPRLFNGLRSGGAERWLAATSNAIAASTNGIGGYIGEDGGWNLKTGANQASHINRVTGLTDPSQYAAQIIRDSGQTGTGVMVYEHPFELAEIVKLRGDKVSLSFDVKAGANWSPSSGNLTTRLACGTGAAARRAGSAYTSETTLISDTRAITTSVDHVDLTSSVVVPTNTTQMSLCFEWTPSGTASADDSFTIDNRMLVPGDVPMPFIPLPPEVEEARCQRWLYAVPAGDFDGNFSSGSVAVFWIPLPVDMRAAPALTSTVAAVSGTPSSTTVGVYRWASSAYVTGSVGGTPCDGYTLKTSKVAARINTSGFSAGAAGDDCFVTLATGGLVVLNAGLA